MTAPVAYFWGDDSYSLERAAIDFATQVAGGPDAPPFERYRTNGAATRPAAIAEKVATATLFGGGALVIVDDAGPLVRAKAERDALYATLAAVAPGNALVFLESTRETKPERRPAGLRALQDAVRAAGGATRQFALPRSGEMARWIAQRATERDIRIEPPAAELLARRTGAFVTEGDVDRRQQGHLVVMELEKLGLYRYGAAIRREDVEALVTEAMPPSFWGLGDAVADRRLPLAADFLERALEAHPEPVVLAVLHRRIRELIVFADCLARGEQVPAIARAQKMQEYPARMRAAQARQWELGELERALDGLLELDASLKGEGNADARRRKLAFGLWLADHVAPR